MEESEQWNGFPQSLQEGLVQSLRELSRNLINKERVNWMQQSNSLKKKVNYKEMVMAGALSPMLSETEIKECVDYKFSEDKYNGNKESKDNGKMFSEMS